MQTVTKILATVLADKEIEPCQETPSVVSAVKSNTKGEIDSKFFVQTKNDAGWANGRYAAFGIVLENNDGPKGMDLVRRISRVEVKTPQNIPKEPISIVGCRVL